MENRVEVGNAKQDCILGTWVLHKYTSGNSDGQVDIHVPVHA